MERWLTCHTGTHARSHTGIPAVNFESSPVWETSCRLTELINFINIHQLCGKRPKTGDDSIIAYRDAYISHALQGCFMENKKAKGKSFKRSAMSYQRLMELGFHYFQKSLHFYLLSITCGELFPLWGVLGNFIFFVF